MSRTSLRIERCLDGRLANAYPASRHDVELRWEGEPPAGLCALLAVKAERVLADDPRCRKVVVAVEAGDTLARRSAELAGFRYVVDVDVIEDGVESSLSLMVMEPEFVTKTDMDLDRVPQT